MPRFSSDLLILLCSMSALIVFASCRHSGPDTSSSSLESRLRTLIAGHPGAHIAVTVLDSTTGTAVEIEADRIFHAASTMKIPVMIEVFRQIDEGRIALDDGVRVENRFTSIVDGSSFSIEDDSDDALYSQAGSEVPVGDLMQQMIVVSSNLATNLLVELVRADSIQATIEDLGTDSMKVYRGVEDLKAFDRGLNNTATASDLAVLLDAIRVHRPAGSQEMIDILLDQEFNDMIPRGLPPSARAAHKTGSITGIAHDAGIIYPESGAPYVLVILTEGFDDRESAVSAGAEITRVVHETLRPDD